MVTSSLNSYVSLKINQQIKAVDYRNKEALGN